MQKKVVIAVGGPLHVNSMTSNADEELTGIVCLGDTGNLGATKVPDPQGIRGQCSVTYSAYLLQPAGSD